MKNRFFPLFITICIFVTQLGTTSVLAESFENLTYEICGENERQYIKITDCTNMSGEIVIPNKISDIPVLEIKDGIFAGATNLTGITIPENVTQIGEGTFFWCNNLKNVTMSDGVTEIGKSAFYNCSSLEKIALPDDLSLIGKYAFYYCQSIKSIEIPENVKEISEGAFKECVSLKEVAIPYGVWTIGDSAFEGCDSLTDVYYTGSEADWSKIRIGELNDCLQNATIHYNYIPKPTNYYNIFGVAIQDSAGRELSEIPQNKGFIVKVDFAKIKRRNTEDYIFVATYDTEGELLNVNYQFSNYELNQKYSVGYYIPKQERTVGSISVYIWNGFNSLVPLAETQTISF